MPKRRVKVSSFYRSDGTSATASPVPTAEPHGTLACFSRDFDETPPFEAKVKRNHFRAIEDVMDSTGRNVKSEYFRTIQDIMNSTGREVQENHFRTIDDIMNSTEQKVNENHFRSIVDIMSSGGPIQAIEDGALVPFEEEFGEIVPYEGKVKRKPFRAKVDKGKDKCLDEERKKFRGWIDSFMNVMHMVQGPQRCAPWGGSVVDSIIGVYLTQNVSDLLSSSAFMSLVAKFPAKSEVSGEPKNRMLHTTSGVNGGWSELPSFTAEDFVSTHMPNDTCILAPYRELLLRMQDNLSFTTLLYLIDPSLSVSIHPPFVPTFGAQSEDTEKALPKVYVGRSKTKKARGGTSEKMTYDFESIRKQVINSRKYKENVESSKQILDLEAIRQADVKEISKTIITRGMNNMLANRIKNFLNRCVSDQQSMDLEWLRHVDDEETAKAYLLSIEGLGPKSVECVRLLTLRHKAFPVDTNVGRICVRLGWVPLQPVPESLQLHLLEQYPVLESIHTYLWPRLSNLDNRTLYDLHRKMITFGKVFCTKIEPNCNACPLRAECRHFASTFSSARLALPGPEEKSSTLGTSIVVETDIEDCVPYDSEGIPVININEFTQNTNNYMDSNTEDANMLSALVALMPEAGSIPTPMKKNISLLRTELQVYELPANSPLLDGFDKTESGDARPHLLCILNPGEISQSSDTPKITCKSQDRGELRGTNACVHCNGTRESQGQKIKGTILIPHRDAMRGIFPLDGTYFQVNEVFADHASSENPIVFPRKWIDDQETRKVYFGEAVIVYFGTSVRRIYKDLEIEKIQSCFWKGSVCVRAFDRTSGAPRPLNPMFFLPSGKRTRKGKMSPAGDDTTVEKKKKKKFISDLPGKLPAQKKRKKFISHLPDKLAAQKKRRG